ncbi:hypothetical protein BGZ74_005220, partial [Mortierella antarctica]
MIRDFALEQSQNSKHGNRTKRGTSQDETRTTSVQRITPPVSPDLGGTPSLSNGATGATGATGSLASSSARRHYFAIVTSPFLRCSQTAIEIAIEWLSLEYAPEPVPNSIVVQRMQEFALARREHEQFYSIDWKYPAQERTLANWPETCEDMQTWLDRALAHIIHSYGRVLQNSDREVDLSIIFVTHASPVNALLEACLQTPVLVPVPNCSISRCRWTPLKAGNEEATRGLRDVLMRSK